MNFSDSSLVPLQELRRPDADSFKNNLKEVIEKLIHSFILYIKLLEDQVQLRDKRIALLEAKLKGKKFFCCHPNCGWYFDEPRKHPPGDITTCPICGALSYEEVDYGSIT